MNLVLYLKLLLLHVGKWWPRQLGLVQEELFIAHQLTHRHSSQGKYIRAYLPGEGLRFGEVEKEIQYKGMLELGLKGQEKFVIDEFGESIPER